MTIRAKHILVTPYSAPKINGEDFPFWVNGVKVEAGPGDVPLVWFGVLADEIQIIGGVPSSERLRDTKSFGTLEDAIERRRHAKDGSQDAVHLSKDGA